MCSRQRQRAQGQAAEDSNPHTAPQWQIDAGLTVTRDAARVQEPRGS
jgi:hypothetical protein